MTKTYPTTSTGTCCGIVREWKGSVSCYCSCGWLETGWPNETIARRSLNNHIATRHPRKQVSPSS